MDARSAFPVSETFDADASPPNNPNKRFSQCIHFFGAAQHCKQATVLAAVTMNGCFRISEKSEHAGQICGELRGFVHGTPGLALDGWQGEIGFVEDAHGHVELAVLDPGVGTHGGLAAGAEDL